MLPYTKTCHALQEGFQAEMIKLDTLKDRAQIIEVTKVALEILRDIKANGDEVDQVDSLKNYILTKSQSALVTQHNRPIQVAKGPNVKIESIAGDGHCFFRSLGYGLHDHCKSHPQYLASLKQSRDALYLQ